MNGFADSRCHVCSDVLHRYRSLLECSITEISNVSRETLSGKMCQFDYMLEPKKGENMRGRRGVARVISESRAPSGEMVTHILFCPLVCLWSFPAASACHLSLTIVDSTALLLLQHKIA